jgi:hypothetical protein
MTNKDDVTLVNEGKRAELALDVFGDALGKRQKAAIDDLVRIYDSGEVDPKPYLASVGKLSCYREILRDLEQLVKKGRKAAEREHNK